MPLDPIAGSLYNGVRSGAINRQEFRHLANRLQDIADYKAFAAADGVITAKEKAVLKALVEDYKQYYTQFSKGDYQNIEGISKDRVKVYDKMYDMIQKNPNTKEKFIKIWNNYEQKRFQDAVEVYKKNINNK